MMNAVISICLFIGISQASAFPQFVRSSSEPKQNSLQACLQCHGNKAAVPPENAGTPRPPLIANQFSMDWQMYELDPAKETPPVLALIPQNFISSGETHYDWSKRKMVEVYLDRCLNIFPSGNDFSCKFLSSYGKTYLIRSELGNINKLKSCCLLSADPFWAPRTDVLRNMGFQKTTGERNKTNWWILDTPLPGPFGYGTLERSGDPVAFWFPVIDKWVQQNFSNYSERQPPPAVFAFPRICREAQVCEE